MTTFEGWTDGGTTFAGDSNDDGVEDGLAWLLGATNPDQHGRDLMPTADEGNADMKIGFQCLSAAKRGSAVLRLQYSADLGATDPWTNHTTPIPDSSSTVSGVAFVITPIAGGDILDVQATIPTTGERVFVRVNGRLPRP